MSDESMPSSEGTVLPIVPSQRQALKDWKQTNFGQEHSSEVVLLKMQLDHIRIAVARDTLPKAMRLV